MARKVYRKAKARGQTGQARKTGYGQKTKLDASIMTLDGENVNIPTFDDLLAVHPLPPELAGMEDTLRDSPAFATMIAVAAACVEHGMDTTGALDAMRVAVDVFYTENHRCAACLGWTTDALLCGALDNGKFTMLAFCRRCEQLINENRATPAMQRNLRAYGGTA